MSSIFDVSGFYIPADYDRTIKSIAHRGLSSVAPENTLPAYIEARRNGFGFAECDVCVTSDGVPVLLHDNSIDRTSNGTGNISSMTFEQARAYDFGSWKNAKYAGTKIPSFEEFISLCKSIGIYPYIEIKQVQFTNAQIQGLVDTVHRFGMAGKVTWISFSSAFLSIVKAYDANARLGLISQSISSSSVETALGLRTESNEVFLDSGDYSQAAVNLCSAQGIPLEIYTIDTESGIIGMNPYVTGITSNKLIAGKVLYEANIT